MNVSSNGINLIKSFEGFQSKPYLCPAGVPTIGYGTTLYPTGKKVSLQDKPISELQAVIYLNYDLQQFVQSVNSLVKSVINQNQFDALVDFAYNLGTNSLKNSTLLKLVNANPHNPAIANEFKKWINANGKPVAGLIRRRQSECDLYFKS